MQVIPVAGHDSMLLNLCGAHAPWFTRNLVILKDSAGRTGLGEVPGGEGIRRALEHSRALVIGQPLGRYNGILNDLRRAIAGGAAGGPQTTRHQVTSDAEAAVLKQPHEINLRLDNVVTAVEAALLDLLGQHLEVPVAELLGSGQQRDSVPMLAYLFYIGDRSRTDLPYLAGSGSEHSWYHIRHQAAMTPESIVRLAEGAYARYGFKDFKLKGGVMSGREEMKAIAGIKARFPRRASHWTPTAPGRSKRPSRSAKARATCSPTPKTPAGLKTAIPVERSWRNSNGPRASLRRPTWSPPTGDRWATHCAWMRSTFPWPIRISGRCRARCAWRRCASSSA